MSSVADRNPHRVLVVDDSSLIREVAKLALTASGWDVLTAASGEEGLARANADRPDVVLLDLWMPGLDGVAVAERLAASPATQHIPVVMLTAADGDADGARLGRMPVAGVIPKPFEPESLAGQVAALVGWEVQ